MKKRGPLFYVLLGLIVLIWGKVFFDVAVSLDQEEPPLAEFAPLSTGDTNTQKPSNYHTFSDTLRDPFAAPEALFWRPPKRVAQAPVKTQKEAPPAPALSLLGVIDDTAMLKGPGDLVLFAKAGDEVFDMKLITVAPERVTARFAGRTITLNLQ